VKVFFLLNQAGCSPCLTVAQLLDNFTVPTWYFTR